MKKMYIVETVEGPVTRVPYMAEIKVNGYWLRMTIDRKSVLDQGITTLTPIHKRNPDEVMWDGVTMDLANGIDRVEHACIHPVVLVLARRMWSAKLGDTITDIPTVEEAESELFRKLPKGWRKPGWAKGIKNF